jgi:hypothetical protein
MSINILNDWKIHVVLKNNQKQLMLSGFVDNDKVLFYAASHLGEIIVSQSGLYYKLGTVHPAYEQQFPNAKKRFLSALRKC